MIQTALTEKALCIAKEAHLGQKDKGGNDYILHPLHLAEQMDTEDLTVLALLHDVVEDSPMTEEDLRKAGIPESVLLPLRLLTRKEGVPYSDYIREIGENSLAIRVKIADLIHNSDLKRLNRAPTKEDKLRVDKYRECIRFLQKKQHPVLVTGVSGGMGQAFARLLLEKGYRVMGLDIKEKGCPPGVHFFPVDVTSADSLEKAFAEIRKETDHLSAIVHFSGIYQLDSLMEIEEENFTKMFNINVFGVYRVNKIFLPLLKKGSRIIITTSELAPLDPLPFTGIYAVTKAALDKYAFSLRSELSLLGIAVTVLRPGAVKTPLLGNSTDALERFVNKTLLYPCNAKRFSDIVNRVEAKAITPEKLAVCAEKLLRGKPKFVKSINRNPLLLLLNLLPPRMQVWILKKILKP